MVTSWLAVFVSVAAAVGLIHPEVLAGQGPQCHHPEEHAWLVFPSVNLSRQLELVLVPFSLSGGAGLSHCHRALHHPHDAALLVP